MGALVGDWLIGLATFDLGRSSIYGQAVGADRAAARGADGASWPRSRWSSRRSSACRSVSSPARGRRGWLAVLVVPISTRARRVPAARRRAGAALAGGDDGLALDRAGQRDAAGDRAGAAARGGARAAAVAGDGRRARTRSTSPRRRRAASRAGAGCGSTPRGSRCGRCSASTASRSAACSADRSRSRS